MNGWTDTRHLGGDAATLPALPPVTPRLRRPVRLVGRADWTPELLAALAQGVLSHHDNHTTDATIETPDD